jgi:acyl-[acyl-carrier-protein] desaturase
MPSIDMPGVNMPHFREMADVIRRAGIYGPREYLKIVEEQIKFWALDKVEGLNEAGKKAQEKILGIRRASSAMSPTRWRRAAAPRRSRSDS